MVANTKKNTDYETFKVASYKTIWHFNYSKDIKNIHNFLYVNSHVSVDSHDKTFAVVATKICKKCKKIPSKFHGS